MSEKKEIGYYHASDKTVVPGYSALFHTLSSKASDADSNGNVGFTENIGGNPHNMLVNIKGQLRLDRDRRGGDRLWQRIYTKEDMIEKMELCGIQMSPVKAEASKETDTKKSESVNEEANKKEDDDSGF